MNQKAATAQIFLARHCKTVWNLENRLIGTTDLPLCDVGINEARENIPMIENLGVNRIVTSPLKRAYETSKTYADHLGLPLHIHQSLREFDHGTWNGQKVEELLEDPNSEFKRWFIDGDTSVAIPEGPETMEEAQQRIVEAIREIALTYEGERVLVVMHKHIRSMFTCALKGVDLSNFRANINESVEPVEIVDEDLQKIL